jgi:hypothetical protein
MVLSEHGEMRRIANTSGQTDVRELYVLDCLSLDGHISQGLLEVLRTL